MNEKKGGTSSTLFLSLLFFFSVCLCVSLRVIYEYCILELKSGFLRCVCYLSLSLSFSFLNVYVCVTVGASLKMTSFFF